MGRSGIPVRVYGIISDSHEGFICLDQYRRSRHDLECPEPFWGRSLSIRRMGEAQCNPSICVVLMGFVSLHPSYELFIPRHLLFFQAQLVSGVCPSWQVEAISTRRGRSGGA